MNVCDGVIDNGYLAYLDETFCCGVAVYCCYHKSVKTTPFADGKVRFLMFGLEVVRNDN